MGFLIDAVATWLSVCGRKIVGGSDDRPQMIIWLSTITTPIKLMQRFSSAVIGGVDSQA